MADLSSAFATRMLQFEAAGLTLDLRPLTANVWLDAFLRDDFGSHVLRSFLKMESRGRIMDAAEAGQITQEDLTRIVHTALTTAGGRDWWETARLMAAVAKGDGQLLGELTLHGVRAWDLSLAEFLAAVFALLLRGCSKEEDRFILESKLSVPPADIEPEEFDEGDFAAAAQRLQNMPGVSIG